MPVSKDRQAASHYPFPLTHVIGLFFFLSSFIVAAILCYFIYYLRQDNIAVPLELIFVSFLAPGGPPPGSLFFPPRSLTVAAASCGRHTQPRIAGLSIFHPYLPGVTCAHQFPLQHRPLRPVDHQPGPHLMETRSHGAQSCLHHRHLADRHGRHGLPHLQGLLRLHRYRVDRRRRRVRVGLESLQ